MGLVPFHMWLPDAYEGSPTTIGALLSGRDEKSRICCSYTCDHPRNVCITPRLDANFSYAGGIYNDTWQSWRISAKKCSKDSCILKHCTGRIYHDWFGISTLFGPSFDRIVIPYNEPCCHEVCSFIAVNSLSLWVWLAIACKDIRVLEDECQLLQLHFRFHC